MYTYTANMAAFGTQVHHCSDPEEKINRKTLKRPFVRSFCFASGCCTITLREEIIFKNRFMLNLLSCGRLC